MQTINVQNIQEASVECKKIIIGYLSSNDISINIALTGGRFGKYFVTDLADGQFPIEKLSIFQTDERFVPVNDKESVQGMLVNGLNKIENIDPCFFNISLNPESCAKDMREKINHIGLIGFDITVLSLGEDGHLAGNFLNSINLDEMITYTKDAPKPPQERISFSLDWISKSNLIILLVLGAEKEKAFKNFVEGSGMFSQLNNSAKKIIIIKDELIVND
jgi:6-phosphogluconolactonase/glucosamine-6-phosphate isomerase/deaminase